MTGPTFAVMASNASRNVRVKAPPLPPRVDAFNPRHAFTRPDAAEAARALVNAFVWEETEEGGVYWADVHKRLRAIARTAPVGTGLDMDLTRRFPHAEGEGGIAERIGFTRGDDGQATT